MKVVIIKRRGGWSGGRRKRAPAAVAAVVMAVLLILYALWRLLSGNEPLSRPAPESMPVLQPVSQDIYFSGEAVKPLLQGKDYFVNYRLQREVYRQATKEMLAPLLDSDLVGTREEAQAKWLQLSDKIHKEEEIENLLKISGLKDAVADLGNKEVAVLVYAPQLEGAEIKLIRDIVLRVANTPPEQISIAYRY